MTQGLLVGCTEMDPLPYEELSWAIIYILPKGFLVWVVVWAALERPCTRTYSPSRLPQDGREVSQGPSLRLQWSSCLACILVLGLGYTHPTASKPRLTPRDVSLEPPTAQLRAWSLKPTLSSLCILQSFWTEKTPIKRQMPPRTGLPNSLSFQPSLAQENLRTS